MKIETVSPGHNAHDPRHVFAALSRGRRRRQSIPSPHHESPKTNGHLPKIPGDRHDEASALLPAAVEWVESQRNILCSPREIRVTATMPATMAAKSPPPTKSLAVAPGFAFPAAGSPVKVILGMRLPISPALALTSLTIDGKPAEGWRLKSGMLLAPGAGISTAKEQQLVAVVLAGWQSLPHVLHLAISLICHHWMDHPEDSQSRQLGESQHQVDQFLHMLTPVGGLRWL